jgi:alkylated DNA nucleotide flippase Atl1
MPSRDTGQVTTILVKPAPQAEMVAQPSARAVAGHGLLGDCHAQPLGPRQLLLVRQEDLDELGVDAWRVRANVAVAGLPGEAFSSGRVLRLGNDVRVRITHECEICKALRRYVDRETFRRLPGRRGALAVLLQGGALGVGDRVVQDPERFPEVSDKIAERAAWIIAKIPEGQVLRYDTLLDLVGGKRAHFRVMPLYVRRAAQAGLPAHRVVTSAGRLSGQLATQLDRLAEEGVPIGADGTVPAGAADWDATAVYTDR